MSSRPAIFHIIGAGIAGLSCARILKQKYPHIRSVVYEAAAAPGGRCQSFYDVEFGCRIDNGTHVIIGANRRMCQFVNKDEWITEVPLWNVETDTLDSDVSKALPFLLKSACNTAEPAPDIIRRIKRLTFPWTQDRRKIYFSKHDLSPRIVNVLAAYADEIHYNCKLLKIQSQFGHAVQLDFSFMSVELGAEDQVIVALDNRNCARLMDFPELPHNGIINIFYRTSQPICLPRGASVVGIIGGLADWVFISDDLLGVTVSDVQKPAAPLPELACMVWRQLDTLRGVNSAFVPSFKALWHKQATLAQDSLTDSRRPQSAATVFSNVFIAGDWTMKGWPCCMETAVLSAERALKAALKR